MRFLITTLLAVIVSGCAADDPVIDGEDAITTLSTEEESTTVVAESAPTDEPASTTVPETLPDPEWAEVEFVLQPVAETDQALAMTVRPDSEDLWLAERAGRVRVMTHEAGSDDEGDDDAEDDPDDAEPTSAVVLDITDKVGTDGEGGLLGLAFSAGGQQLYVSYTDRAGTSVIAEYEMEDLVADEDTERILLEIEQPFSNHNGGQITIGPDGHLYVALGDGGSGGDPLGSGQDTSTLLGAVLRIDPDAGSADAPYAVPADNPFVDRAGFREEIWLYGVRNPWRFSFDAVTGDLWIADVGQDEVEEIDFLPVSADEPAGRGANLGWNIMEAELPFSGETPPADLVGPIAWYGHDNGRCSITGGYVYRGSRITELEGVYVFGDFCTGEVFGVKRFTDGRITQAPLNVGGELGQIVSFGQGPDNELYVFESDGTLSQLQIQAVE